MGFCLLCFLVLINMISNLFQRIIELDDGLGIDCEEFEGTNFVE